MAETANATGAKSGDVIEPTVTGFVLRSQVAEVISTYRPLWQQTPERAQASREILNGDSEAPIAKAFVDAVPDIEAFRANTPDKYLIPYHLRNTIAKNVPRVERRRRGEAEPLKLEATKIEQIMQAVMDEKFVYRDAVDILLNESVCISITIPDVSLYSKTPSIYEPNSSTVKERYARNAQGKSKAESPSGWRLSAKASKKEHERDKREYLARKIPLSKVDLLGPTAFIPVFGPGLVLDAVVVERYWTIGEFDRQGYWYDGFERQLTPAGSASETAPSPSPATNRVKVTELHATDEQDDGCHPYVAYFTDSGSGKLTPIKDRDTDKTVILDLRDAYGLKQFHVKLKWGQQWAHPEYDKKGMPFPLPFAQSWKAIDAILTGVTVWAWWRGFPTLIEQPSQSSQPEITSQGETPDEPITIEPLGYIRANGTVTELGSAGPAPIVMDLVRELKGANVEQGPPNAAFGGGGESGFQASLARSYSDDSMDDVRQGAIELFKETASVAFEELTGIAADDRYGGTTHSIPIQRLVPVPLGKRSGPGTWEILDLTANMAGDIFDLEAHFPPVPNLAKGQQWAEWARIPMEQGGPLVTDDEFRTEIIGDEHPEVFRAQVMAQMFLKSPQGMQQVAAIMAQLAGQQDKAQRIAALQGQQAEMGTDGQIRPAAPGQMLGALPPGAPPQGAPGPGLTGAGGPPSAPQSALAGSLGGPIAAANNAAAAGGAVPGSISIGA